MASSLRLLYTFLLAVAVPFWWLRLLGRGAWASAYRPRWRERFGFFQAPPVTGSLWLHAASMGEVAAAAPLIRALQQRYPQQPLVVTTLTPTGSAQVRALFGNEVFHVYLPYDLPGAVRRFLERTRPALAIMLETEIWPNLYRACRRRGLPILLANARLSERSLRTYRRLGGLVREALRAVSWIGAQSAADAERYRTLGASAVQVELSGNLKFDAPTPTAAWAQGAALRRGWVERPVWIAASTHEGEETAIWQAHRLVREQLPTALLLLAPRHPERFRAVEAAVREQGFSLVCRSRNERPAAATQVWLIDTMGELLDFYAVSDVAFVGGSLTPTGGHNLLEPAALARPILSGPHTYHNTAVADSLQAAGVLLRVDSAATLASALLSLLQDPGRRQAQGAAASAVLARGRGALARTLARVAALREAQT